MPPTFAALGVPEPIARGLERRGITDPFPIQVATIPDALAGRDVCGRAPTGSGKTLAFGIPLAARVTHAGPKAPKALILVPTRELAGQVQRELAALLQPMGRTVHAFYGGVGIGPQITALRKGVDVVVACPGRLADLIDRGAVRLDRVDIVVLDEADRMADMGFLPEVRRLLDQVGPDRQTLLFSATLDGDVDVLIRRYQRDPARHGIDRDDDEPTNRHFLWRAERAEKVALTAQVVTAHWPAIVFTRTKHGADRLARQLGRLDVDAVAIHGNRSQSQRERALRDFTSGRAQALVATDVAARGIHVDGVACVVHFDAPPDHKDFVHRSGRTGRAGTEGLVVTLTPQAEVRAVAKMMGKAGVVGVAAEDPDVSALGRSAPRPSPAPGADAKRSAGGNGRRDDRRPSTSSGGPTGGPGPARRRKPRPAHGTGRDDRPATAGEGRSRDGGRDGRSTNGSGGGRSSAGRDGRPATRSGSDRPKKSTRKGRPTAGSGAGDRRSSQALNHDGEPRRGGGGRSAPSRSSGRSGSGGARRSPKR